MAIPLNHRFISSPSPIRVPYGDDLSLVMDYGSYAGGTYTYTADLSIISPSPLVYIKGLALFTFGGAMSGLVEDDLGNTYAMGLVELYKGSGTTPSISITQSYIPIEAVVNAERTITLTLDVGSSDDYFARLIMGAIY